MLNFNGSQIFFYEFLYDVHHECEQHGQSELTQQSHPLSNILHCI